MHRTPSKQKQRTLFPPEPGPFIDKWIAIKLPPRDIDKLIPSRPEFFLSFFLNIFSIIYIEIITHKLQITQKTKRFFPQNGKEIGEKRPCMCLDHSNPRRSIFPSRYTFMFKSTFEDEEQPVFLDPAAWTSSQGGSSWEDWWLLVVTVVAVIAAAFRRRRQYVASKHARCYERRVSAVPALISGKPPQICPANSGSLSLIVVKKRG